MAGPYYVDLTNVAAWNGRTGLDSTTNKWLGILGLQKAVDTAVAGEIVYIYGTGDGSKVYSVPYDNSSGAFTEGEAVTWHDGAGVIYEGLAATPCRIEITSGTVPHNNDTITGSTSGKTFDVNGTPAVDYEVDCDTNAGSTTADGFIKYIGVNSSWTNDGTLATLDGKASGTNIDGFYCYDPDTLWFENIKVLDVTQNGFDTYTGASCYFLNCHAVDCDDVGFDGYIANVYIMCTAHGNGQNGFQSGGAGGRWLFCQANANTLRGFSIGHESCLGFGNVSWDNVTDGYSMYSTCTLINSVADNNTQDGIEATSSGAILLGVRITDNRYGIEGASKLGLYGWCYMPADGSDKDNDTDQLNGATLLYALSPNGSDTNNLAGTDTDGGYVDSAGGDFNLAGTATLRRTAITPSLQTS